MFSRCDVTICLAGVTLFYYIILKLSREQTPVSGEPIPGHSQGHLAKGSFIRLGHWATFILISTAVIQRPIGMAQQFTTQCDQVCPSVAQNILDLLQAADQADCDGRDLTFAPDCFRETHLVARVCAEGNR